MVMVVYCPKCGDITCRSQTPAYCSYCKTEYIITNCTYDEYFENRRKIKQKIFEECIKSSPEFDEELYKKREEENHKRIYGEGTPVTPRNDILKCPKCGSAAVTTGARGFSIVTGFLGSGQTVNRCGNCGHKWKPRV